MGCRSTVTSARFDDNQQAKVERNGGGVIMAFDICSRRCDVVQRILALLGYDCADVYEVRVTQDVIEVDYIDFMDLDWPVVTRRHAAMPMPSFSLN
jgi:hypothetical protein